MLGAASSAHFCGNRLGSRLGTVHTYMSHCAAVPLFGRDSREPVVSSRDMSIRPAANDLKHKDFMGATSSHRFRPGRVQSCELAGSLVASFNLEGDPWSTKVLDVSSTGLALEPVSAVCAPGVSLSDLELMYDGKLVWSGAGEVIYQVGEPAGRIGVRFTTGLIEVAELKYRNVLQTSEASSAIDLTVQAATNLPDAWRARVADAHHLLQVARSHFEACEEELAQLGIERLEREPALIRAFYDSWVPKYRAVFTELYEISMGFDHKQIELGSHYAERHLYPLLRGCPLHSRSHDKPSGYAGDYQTMLLCSGPDYLAGSLYERFLYWVARNYTMVRTVPARQRFLRDRLVEAAATTRGLKKVVSIACGPATEIQEFVRAMEPTAIKFVLVDQDAAALAYANDKIAAAILSNPKLGDEVEVECLHLSVRQLMKPDSEELLASIARLRDATLVYSAGLFDYFPDGVAQKLLMRLYDLLGTGGRLLVGNLRETPDTTWLLDYVLNWPLVYRTRESMQSLASVLKPAPKTLRISFDGTERCLFWDVERPG